jgi:hypothetical protein
MKWNDDISRFKMRENGLFDAKGNEPAFVKMQQENDIIAI